jgi:hypothetical protein
MSYINLDVVKEIKGEGIDIFSKRDDDNDTDTCLIKRLKLFTISCNNPAPDSNVSVPELKDSQYYPAQSPQLGLVVISLQQLNLTNAPLLRHYHSQDTTRNVCCK